MNISTNTLDKFIRNWDRSIKWNDGELRIIRNHLLGISLNNGGRINYDIKLKKKIEEDYITSTISNAFQKVMNLYANSIQCHDQGVDFYYETLDGIKPVFDFLWPVRYIPKIDLNKASPEELEPLLGIGPVTSQKIVDYREQTGPFENIDGVMNVQGIDKNDFKKFVYAVHASTPLEEAAFVSPLLSRFKFEPTFSNYVKLIKESKGRFILGYEAAEENAFKNVILDELRKIDEYISKNHYSEFNKYRRIKASRISEIYNQRLTVNKLEKNASTDITGATVLDDSEYYYFVKKALSKAKEKIRIIMFFMLHKDKKKYPTNQLIQELLSAKKRGVDVKIILDKDAEGQVYKSRVINKEAHNKFKKSGIDVVYDSEEKVTHTKIILIDDRHTIIGSHNWTAGSFYAYDDKSVYIDSKDLAKKTYAYFNKLWIEYVTSDIDPYSIGDIEGIGEKYADKLEKVAIKTTLDLLLKAVTPGDRKKLAQSTGISSKHILRWANLTDLMRIKGTGEEYSDLLEQVGVDTVPELAQRNPDNLYKAIEKFDISKARLVRRKPSLSKVKSWVIQAKKLPRILEY